ncbi:MAG: 2-amino-4-hydroxy-6-hydroxymethyldihydropteridine diphosphokinase [Candidatus Latescibacteria bacterium]|nr:2-amino-4-hydroxy-6-hydroxymethyldihydropteridine diphosphokinase [Candidatus Latescibacterota bacterium]
MTTIYIGLGSNLDDREAFINQAVEKLSQKIQILSVSSLYETAPLGVTQQPPFLNAVLKANTSFSPRELLNFTQLIEKRLGRKRTQPWSPRTVDLDLLFYDDLVLEEPNLIIPHPRLHQRAFVLIPLCEIEPLLLHPVLKKPVCLLLKENCEQQSVRLFSPLKKRRGGLQKIPCENQ